MCHANTLTTYNLVFIVILQLCRPPRGGLTYFGRLNISLCRLPLIHWLLDLKIKTNEFICKAFYTITTSFYTIIVHFKPATVNIFASTVHYLQYIMNESWEMLKRVKNKFYSSSGSSCKLTYYIRIIAGKLSQWIKNVLPNVFSVLLGDLYTTAAVIAFSQQGAVLP